MCVCVQYIFVVNPVFRYYPSFHISFSYQRYPGILPKYSLLLSGNSSQNIMETHSLSLSLVVVSALLLASLVGWLVRRSLSNLVAIAGYHHYHRSTRVFQLLLLILQQLHIIETCVCVKCEVYRHRILKESSLVFLCACVCVYSYVVVVVLSSTCREKKRRKKYYLWSPPFTK